MSWAARILNEKGEPAWETPNLLPSEHMAERVACGALRNLHEGYLTEVIEISTRRHEIAGCSTCKHPGHPSHDASPNCESGGYTHCSCDTCH